MLHRAILLVALGLAVLPLHAAPSTHPHLAISAGEVAAMRANLGKYPLFDAAVREARERVDLALAEPIDVPVPRDAAGYTHERHKRNYAEMHAAGILFQLTGDRRCVDLIAGQLDRYAELYPALKDHPAARSSSPGRLFHQTLNDTVWLVHVSQAYDCVHDALAPEQRARYEERVFRPMARFLTGERARDLDRIHNHGTWSAAAVGLIGYAMGDATLVKKALLGSKMDGAGGYLRQFDELFSPDGYYVEGPYYTRYALMPFFLMAEVVERNDPAQRIYERRDGLLGKALHAALQQTYVNGEFIPFNDAMKDKTIRSSEVLLALDLTYARCGRDPRLLAVAQKQGGVALSPAGFEVARALAEAEDLPAYPYASVELRDGPDGSKGGVGILRTGTPADQSLALLKYTSFGMEHGHYDKLALLFYNQGREVIQDYGAARFLNIEQKYGGRYLPENKSFALQTIAHNTVTVDEQSHYAGKYDTAEHAHAERHFFSAADADFQVMSGRDTTAVPGVAMQRTVALVRDARLPHPVVIDVFRCVAADPHRYDLPCYYMGHFLQTNVQLTRHVKELRPLGTAHGYQHLWLEAEGQVEQGPVSFTWLEGARYYSITAAADAGTKVLFTRIGANDPNFNLRHEPAFMLRRDGAAPVFASVIEPHGIWDGTREFTSGGFPAIRDVRVLAATDDGTVVRVVGEKDLVWTLLISNRPAGAGGAHRIEAAGEVFAWEGNAVLRRQ